MRTSRAKGQRPRAEGRIRTRRHLESQGGFSLLEVVVAFAILSLSLGVLLQIFSSAVNATALSGAYGAAVTLAEERLNTVGLEEIPLEVGTHAGELEDGFRWQVLIDYYEPGAVTWEPTRQPYRVTSTVAWDTAAGTRQVSLSTLRLGEPL